MTCFNRCRLYRLVHGGVQYLCPHWWGEKMMNFALKVMHRVLKMMNFATKYSHAVVHDLPGDMVGTVRADAVCIVYTCRRLIDLSNDRIVYTCRRLIDLSNDDCRHRCYLTCTSATRVKMDEFVLTNAELRIKNEEICILNDEFCSTVSRPRTRPIWLDLIRPD